MFRLGREFLVPSISWAEADLVVQIVYYGIPSAATLSVELLKQSKGPHELRVSLPRSEIIQNLSIFIGALEWVRPTEGNYTLCKSSTSSKES